MTPGEQDPNAKPDASSATGAPPAGEAAPDESGEARAERLAAELEARTVEARENYDRFLRERADLENFKKRMQRERAESLRFAEEGLIRDLLPVLDNLERAVEHAESGGNGAPLVEGVRLVLRSALDILERHGVKRLEVAGQPFDPALHEALLQVPDPDREPNRVVQQFLCGYLLHDRLLRPAQVSVSSTPPKPTEPVDNGQDRD